MATAKQNTPSLDIEYEVHLPAYFALLLNTNPEIEDFTLRCNVPGFGNLDNLLLSDIKTRGGENLYFAFQLKHKEKSGENLLPTNFEARSDFNLEKYCEAFKQLNEENRKKYHIILYTNKNFDSSHTTEVKSFYMKATQDVYCFGKEFFDTSGGGNNLYKFEIKEETEEGKNVNKKDYEEFFSKFSLYTGQADFGDLANSHILKILKYKDCCLRYIEFFRKWYRGDFTDFNNKMLDKKTLNVHLVDIFLSSVAIKYHLSNGQDGNLIFFETMVQQFDITIIDASKQDFIKQLEENVNKYSKKFNKEEHMIRLAKNYKFIDRSSSELTEEIELKLLHYFYQKPLILDFNESSKDLIYEASNLCRIQENGIKLVIMGKDIDVSKFSRLKIFRNLTQVNGYFLEETKKRCKLSLQGRNISFEEIFEDEIREFVTPREIFQMLKGNFSIGEGKEKLPEYYIPRTVSTTVFDIESIIKYFSTSNAIIFYYEDKFEELKILIQNIVDPKDYFYKNFLDGVILKEKEPPFKYELPAIILTKEECSRKQLNEIRMNVGIYEIHLLKVIDEKRCLLVMSTKDIISLKENYKSTKMYVEERNIQVFLDKSINILCAPSGMGKSTLMRYLKNEYNSNSWTLRVDLKAHNQFLKRHHEIEDVLKYFLDVEKSPSEFSKRIKTVFLRKKKIVLFLDGLDEVEHKYINRVLEISELLGEMGFRIWLSSRQNLQQKIEQYFNIFAIEINELDEDQQKNYIENSLTSLYNKNEIKEIVEKIFSNTNLANNRQILEIPLQLQIITQIFIDDQSHYYNLSKNNFIHTKMFEIFFKGKCKHYLTNIELNGTHSLINLEAQLEDYEIVALHSVLDNEHFQKLQISKPTVTQIKTSDCFGIITKINSENRAVFEHLTFAEYFASKFLVKNFDKARILKEEMFTEKYQNLLLIFNIMLTEDSPLHFAIIYKDLNRIQEMEASPVLDKGGRNFLQVATCVATRHPHLEFSSDNYLVQDLPVQHFKGEDSTMKEIVNLIVLSSDELFKNDKIFEWNTLDYALVTGALYIVEAILEKFEKPSNFCNMLGKYYSDEVIAYYSIRFGYHRLLSEILSKDCCRVTWIISDYLSSTYVIERKSIIQFLFESDCTNRTRILELLTGGDINKIVNEEDGYTFLHFAVFNDDIEFIKFLLEKKADPNIKGKKYGLSPLCSAVKQNKLEISKLLVENRADVNIKDEDKRSPLFWAISGESLEISKLLVDKGANVNIKDKYCGSLLHLAVQQNFEISKLLVDKGADVNIKDENRTSPLYWAVERNNLEISKLLVEKGADVNNEDVYGFSPLRCAIYRKNLEISKLLVEKGAYVNIKDKFGETPLFWAINTNNFEISKLLAEKGAKINIKNKDGWSPLNRAIVRNNLEISKLLIEKGAKINIKDKYGESPLFWGVKRNNIEISKLLIELGADVNCETKRNKTFLSSVIAPIRLFRKETSVNEASKISPVLRLAVKNGNFNLVQILIESGAIWNVEIILDAIEGGNIQTIDLFLAKGVDLSKVNDVLYWAVRCNNTDVINYLINNGADVNLKSDGFTILHKASSWGLLDVVELLLNNPKTAHLLFEPDKSGSICLHLAVYFGHVQVVQLLLQTEIDLDKIDIHNVKYPLHFAASDGRLQKELLIEMTRVVNKLLWTKNHSIMEIVNFLENNPVISD